MSTGLYHLDGVKGRSATLFRTQAGALRAAGERRALTARGNSRYNKASGPARGPPWNPAKLRKLQQLWQITFLR